MMAGSIYCFTSNQTLFVSFIDPVQALKEVWIIGEGFLRSSFSTLQSMKMDSKVPP